MWRWIVNGLHGLTQMFELYYENNPDDMTAPEIQEMTNDLNKLMRIKILMEEKYLKEQKEKQLQCN